MEAIKSRKTNIIVLLLSIGFLFLASCAFAQGEMRLLKDNNTFFPNYTIVINSNGFKSDTLFLGIKADSISKTIVSPNLYTFIPRKNINAHKGICVYFQDGTKEVFKVVYVDKEEGYVEYQFTETAYINLSNKSIKSILFDGIGRYSADKYKDYFIDFLNLL